MAEVIAHAAVAVTVIVAYTVVTALGGDATALLTLLAGQALGGGISKAAEKRRRS